MQHTIQIQNALQPVTHQSTTYTQLHNQVQVCSWMQSKANFIVLLSQGTFGETYKRNRITLSHHESVSLFVN